MSLIDKIIKRDTELQIAYDSYLSEKQKSIDKIQELEYSLKKEKNNLSNICLNIRKCHDRAIEQGFPNAL